MIKNNLVIIISDLDDWLVNGVLPENIIPVSLSDGNGCDDYVINMIASNQY